MRYPKEIVYAIRVAPFGGRGREETIIEVSMFGHLS